MSISLSGYPGAIRPGGAAAGEKHRRHGRRCYAHGARLVFRDGLHRGFEDTPEGYRPISLLSIGHPAEEPLKDKRPLSEMLHWDRF
jgi:hypothetical protein